MNADPYTNEAHAARQIRACRSEAELDGYEAEAKRRGIAPHEVRLIRERRQRLREARG